MSNLVCDHKGHCPICEKETRFTAEYTWYRDHLLCAHCQSIPRERALMTVIQDYYPDYKNLAIHESSPGTRGVSQKLLQECTNYSYSYFFEDIEPGKIHPKENARCENLEALTFPDESFDLFITQDVMEHIFHPMDAFKEIARILRPGGAHIFTAPLTNKIKPSEIRAQRENTGEITHFYEAEYHGDPVNPKGALVTMNWGYDIVSYIFKTAQTPSILIQIDDIDKGIRAEYIDVIVSIKQNPGASIF